MRLVYLILLVIVATVVSSSGLYFLLAYNSGYTVQETLVSVCVSPNIGFDLEDDHLRFGCVMPNGPAHRNITLGNTRGYPILVGFEGSGDLGDWLILPGVTRIDPGESVPFRIGIHVPSGVEYGNYTGSLVTNIKRTR